MRKAIALLLMACLGMMIPLAGSPLRLCLLENRLLVGGSECGVEKCPCCPDCGDHHKDPCCVELDEFPDAPAPAAPEELAAIPAIDLPAPFFIPPPLVIGADSVFEVAAPIRGPDSPAARRAILGVWRL